MNVTTYTINTRILKYTPDAILHYFSTLEHKPWSILLTSGRSDHVNNRFDILTAEPRISLITVNDITSILKENIITFSNEDPLKLVQEQCEIFKVIPKFNSDLPFQGGAIGLFGYDLGRRFEKLPKKAKQDLITPDMAIGIYDWALISDHHLQKLTLISITDIDARWKWLLSQRAIQSQPFMLTSKWKSNLSFDDYAERFFTIQAYIKNGDCYQVNLAQRFKAQYQGSEWQIFLKLNRINRAPFSAFLRLPKSALLSFSPERFLSLQKNKIESRPIKGTLPRLSNPLDDQKQAKKLNNIEKEKAENLMIVDLLRNDIGRVAVPGSVKVPELFMIEKFPTVYHLVSTIHARLLQNFSPVDLIRSCFPGGSITGAPKIRAMEIIEELEPHRRNAWCGSIGYISLCNRMDINITIRTLITEKENIYCNAGGGIVADSILETEYQETLHKVNNLLHIKYDYLK